MSESFRIWLEQWSEFLKSLNNIVNLGSFAFLSIITTIFLFLPVYHSNYAGNCWRGWGLHYNLGRGMIFPQENCFFLSILPAHLFPSCVTSEMHKGKKVNKLSPLPPLPLYVYTLMNLSHFIKKKNTTTANLLFWNPKLIIMNLGQFISPQFYIRNNILSLLTLGSVSIWHSAYAA